MSNDCKVENHPQRSVALLEKCRALLADLTKVHPRFVRWDAEKLLPEIEAEIDRIDSSKEKS